MIKRTLTAFLFLLATTALFAQGKYTTMADEMRSNGKIFVVVAVIATIFIGIVIYLIRMDRKISKLENH
ncbi:MAG: CcmD family protein [Chitinophagaceae bacterium]